MMEKLKNLGLLMWLLGSMIILVFSLGIEDNLLKGIIMFANVLNVIGFNLFVK